MSDSAKSAMYGTIAFASLAVSLWAFGWAVNSKRRARFLLLSIGFSQLTIPVYILAHYLEQKHFWATSFMLSVVLWSTGSVGAMIVETFLSPLKVFARVQLPERIRVWLLLFSFSCFAVPFVFWMPACWLLQQGQENSFNLVVAIYFFGILLLLLAIWLPLLYVESYTLKLLKSIEHNAEAREPAKQFATSLRFVSRMFVLIFAFIAVTSIGIIWLQLQFSVYPYRFILFWVITMTFPAFGAACVLFAKFRVRSETSRPKSGDAASHQSLALGLASSTMVANGSLQHTSNNEGQS